MIMQRGLAKIQFEHNQFLVKQKLLMCKILWAIINPHNSDGIIQMTEFIFDVEKN